MIRRERERERESKIKDCSECQQHIRSKIIDCQEWEIKRKSWWTNLLTSEDKCFHKKLKGSAKMTDIQSTLCSKCWQSSVSQRKFSGEGGEVNDEDAVVGCPNFEEQSPCKNCNPNDRGKNICEKCKQPSSKPLERISNARTGKGWMACPTCFHFCQLCKKNRHEFITNEDNKKWEANMFLCRECSDKLPGNKKQRKLHSNEVCERCQREERYWRVRWIVNHTEEIHWFGENCSCLQQFKKERVRTCPQCHKTEWPDLKKGWLIDYEIKKVFCSPACHVAYRNLSWEQAGTLTQIEMMPPELELPTAEIVLSESEASTSENGGQNIDWEEIGLKKEVLFWKEYSKELEQKLSNQSNLTPEEQQQANYLKNLQDNTLKSAEQAYSSKYGSLNKKSNSSNSKNWTPLIIGGVLGVGMIVGLVIWLVMRGKNKEESRNELK